MSRFSLRRAAARARPFAFAPLCASLLPAFAPAALAQTADAPVLQAVEVQGSSGDGFGTLNLDVPAETGSRLGLSARQTPASVTVVERGAIEARGAQDTLEMVHAIPGASAHNAPGSTSASMRGFSGGSVSQMFNGISVHYGSANRAVDDWIYERVEAVGGASGFLHGSGAIGGAINLVTKTAERSDFSEARLRLGSHGMKEASVGLNRRLAGSAGGTQNFARLDLNHKDAGSWTHGTHARATQLAASLLTDFGGGFTHLLAYEWQHEHVDRPSWGTPTLQPDSGAMRIDPATRFQNYNSADGLYAQRVQWLRSIAQWRASGALVLTNTLYAYDALRDWRNVETYRFNAGNTLVTRSNAYLQRHDQQLVGDRLEGRHAGQLAGRRSDWAFGLDASVNRQTRFPRSVRGPFGDVDPYRFSTGNFFDMPGTTPGFEPDRDNKTTIAALYAENRTALVPGVHLLTGLRHERIALDLVNRRAITAASPAAFSRSLRATTGRLGLTWDITPHASVYAQFATAGDPPSGSLSTASFADAMNNSELTTGRQWEVGSKLDFWQGKGNATLAAFHISRRNIAVADPNNPGITQQVGQQSSQGVELAVALRPAARWQLQANLMLARSRYDDFVEGGVSMTGNTPARTPTRVANLWLTHDVTPQLGLNAGLRHVGRVWADSANTQFWPSYTTLDVGAAYKVSRGTTLTARLRNAADRVYAAEVRPGQVLLGAPRTADVTLHVAF